MKIPSCIPAFRERFFYALACAFRILGRLIDALSAVVFICCFTVVIPIIALIIAWVWLTDLTGDGWAGAGLVTIGIVVSIVIMSIGERVCYSIGLRLTASSSPRAKELLTSALQEWEVDNKPGYGY